MTANDVWAYKNPAAPGGDKDAYYHLLNVDKDVWATTVDRSGKPVSALQELADAKSEGIRANGKLDALLTAIKGLSTPTVDVSALAAEIAKLIPAPTVDYAALAKAVNDDAHARMKA